jgi:hypothetical protein
VTPNQTIHAFTEAEEPDRDFTWNLAGQFALRALLYARKETLASSPSLKENRYADDPESLAEYAHAVGEIAYAAKLPAPRDLSLSCR